MKTTTPKLSQITKAWYIVNADGKTLGHIAVRIADVLRGKHKPTFTPHLDCGDHVVVINAEKIRLSGSKEEKKQYFSHTGFPGGLKEVNAATMRQKKPTEILRLAVYGMLPKNKMRAVFMDKLKIYTGEDHPHTAQTPEPLDI